jgi:F0F1-type ATP synthase membrane subunit b/b'
MEKENKNFTSIWDKTVFISSIVGLIVVISLMFFRYNFLIPEQQKVSGTTIEKIEKLKKENQKLRKQIEILKEEYERND